MLRNIYKKVLYGNQLCVIEFKPIVKVSKSSVLSHRQKISTSTWHQILAWNTQSAFSIAWFLKKEKKSIQHSSSNQICNIIKSASTISLG